MSLETRSQDEREAAQLVALQGLMALVQDHNGSCFPAGEVQELADLRKFPVLRKDTLHDWQVSDPPLGGMLAENVSHIFQSPGPIYEPGGSAPDFWRMGRFLRAMGFTAADVAQNTFSYHFTPAGMMFESGASAIGMTVFPAGPGNTAQQAEVAAAIGTTGYVGTPDYLATILAKGEEAGLDLSRINKAAVSAGPLFPQIRQGYADKGILCRQCYGTADAGLIAYESADGIEGMIIDEDVILEVVVPGTGDPVAEGEIGEVLVTVLNPDYPLLRFSTGDLSALMPGQSACGRTNRRIVGWRGRADQATKVKGMFIRPEQVATLVARHADVDKARVEVSHNGSGDQITVQLETDATDAAAFAGSVSEILKLRAQIDLVAKGSLPRDGIVVSDIRKLE